MKIGRRPALFLHFLLDECIPPILRDRKWFMWLPFKLLFKDKADIFFDFKNKALRMSKEEFAQVYEETITVHIQRETDLNEECVREIERNIAGEKVLEVGCGRGYLANILSEKHEVAACDIRITPTLCERYPRIRFLEENVQELSFRDGEFDTVICTHTLEHLQDIAGAIAELRRVAKTRLIVVVPRQRPYQHTFDLHLHFFPYAHILLSQMSPAPDTLSQELKEIQGDWYFQEDKR